jgi:hypothetical protein
MICISGNKQIWSITSKKLAAEILNQLINGKSVLDVTKTRVFLTLQRLGQAHK